jgi:hypothetical protein
MHYRYDNESSSMSRDNYGESRGKYPGKQDDQGNMMYDASANYGESRGKGKMNEYGDRFDAMRRGSNNRGGSGEYNARPAHYEGRESQFEGRYTPNQDRYAPRYSDQYSREHGESGMFSEWANRAQEALGAVKDKALGMMPQGLQRYMSSDERHDGREQRYDGWSSRRNLRDYNALRNRDDMDRSDRFSWSHDQSRDDDSLLGGRSTRGNDSRYYGEPSKFIDETMKLMRDQSRNERMQDSGYSISGQYDHADQNSRVRTSDSYDRGGNSRYSQDRFGSFSMSPRNNQEHDEMERRFEAYAGQQRNNASHKYDPKRTEQRMRESI